MLHVLLLAGAVGFPFSLNLDGFEFPAADSWNISTVARIHLDDYLEPEKVSNAYAGGFFVQVYPDPDCSWKVVMGDGHRVVSVRDGHSPQTINIEDGWYSILRSASEQYVLLLSELNDLLATFRYSLETGDGSPIVFDRDKDYAGYLGHFESLMSSSGDVFFIDIAGNIGCYSDSHGYTEQAISDGVHGILIDNQALSDDGSLYVASICWEGNNYAVLGYSAEGRLLWNTNMRIGGNDLEVSPNGSFVVADKTSGGIAILDGRTGSIVNSVLPGKRVNTLAISPNGRFVASSFSTSRRGDTMSFSCVDTQSPESSDNGSAEEHVTREIVFVRAVTDDGAFLVESLGSPRQPGLRYFLYDRAGNALWQSPVCHSGGGLISPLLNGAGSIALSSVAATDDGYIIGYCIPDSSEVDIIRIGVE